MNPLMKLRERKGNVFKRVVDQLQAHSFRAVARSSARYHVRGAYYWYNLTRIIHTHEYQVTNQPTH